MAESDAAGPGSPGGPTSRALTREDFDRLLAEGEREWAALTPEERAQRKAESEKADRDAFEEANRAMRPTLEAFERSISSAKKEFNTVRQLPQLAAETFDPPRGIGHDPSDRDRALAEILDAVEPARPLRAEDVRKAVADGVREALAEAAKEGPADSGQPATYPAVGGVVWSLPIVQAVRAVASLNILDQPLSEPATGLSADLPPNETPAKPSTQPPVSAQRPPFELAPSKRLLDALREAFPGFMPTDQWWFHVERELIDTHKRSNPEGHDAFRAAYRHWSAEDLVRHLETEGRIAAKPRGRKRKRTVEGMDVHQWLMAMAVKDPSIRYLSEREAKELGPFSARGIGLSWVWKQWKRDLKAEAAEAAERAAAELANRYGEDEDAGGLRLSSTKHGIGIQRATAEDLEHERKVEDFLAKAGQARKLDFCSF